MTKAILVVFQVFKRYSVKTIFYYEKIKIKTQTYLT